MDYLERDHMSKIMNIFIDQNNPCIDKCYNKALEDYRKCFKICQNFQIKKSNIIDYYLEQLDDSIDGNTKKNYNLRNRRINIERKRENNDEESLVNKYIFNQYYYQSLTSSSTDEAKKSTGSLFGRNK